MTGGIVLKSRSVREVETTALGHVSPVAELEGAGQHATVCYPKGLLEQWRAAHLSMFTFFLSAG